jgi:predicted hotdog family 3-hydroxylacyl-ACP dehydratase
LKATIAVPAGGAYFGGHFPGRPILPGVAELLLVQQAIARGSARPRGLRGIGFARLRQLVGPGEELELDTHELDDGRMRIELTRKGVVVANGELLLGSPDDPAVCERLVPATGAVGTVPSLDELLPHRAPMRFVTSVLGETANGIDCSACIPAACGLVHAGDASALAGVEAAAQAAATWEAVRRWRETNSATPRVGYLVALRDVVFFAEQIPPDRALVARVRLDAMAPPLSHYRFEVALDGAPLASGRIATFLAAQSA